MDELSKEEIDKVLWDCSGAAPAKILFPTNHKNLIKLCTMALQSLELKEVVRKAMPCVKYVAKNSKGSNGPNNLLERMKAMAR